MLNQIGFFAHAKTIPSKYGAKPVEFAFTCLNNNFNTLYSIINTSNSNSEANPSEKDTDGRSMTWEKAKKLIITLYNENCDNDNFFIATMNYEQQKIFEETELPIMDLSNNYTIFIPPYFFLSSFSEFDVDYNSTKDIALTYAKYLKKYSEMTNYEMKPKESYLIIIKLIFTNFIKAIKSFFYRYF